MGVTLHGHLSGCCDPRAAATFAKQRLRESLARGTAHTRDGFCKAVGPHQNSVVITGNEASADGRPGAQALSERANSSPLTRNAATLAWGQRAVEFGCVAQAQGGRSEASACNAHRRRDAQIVSCSTHKREGWASEGEGGPETGDRLWPEWPADGDDQSSPAHGLSRMGPGQRLAHATDGRGVGRLFRRASVGCRKLSLRCPSVRAHPCPSMTLIQARQEWMGALVA
jgi:hypothetical protein